MLHRFIEQHSFATLITVPRGEPFASHLPLLIEPDHAPHGRLVGHMARANPQWRDADGTPALAIFHGPHAYISPAWYEAQNVVPTWNYVAVHVRGTLRVVADRSQLYSIVERTVETYERGRKQAWSIDDPDAAFIDGLLNAIVGFTIDIEHIEGKWKLSQNHDAARRERVVQALRAEGGEDRLNIAAMMEQSLPLQLAVTARPASRDTWPPRRPATS
jgi:transcriptional regulator